MIEGIVYNNRPQQEALLNRLNIFIQASDIPQDIKDGLSSYTWVKDHPTNGKVCLVIDRSGYYWTYIESELTQAEKNSIETLTADWFNNDL